MASAKHIAARAMIPLDRNTDSRRETSLDRCRPPTEAAAPGSAPARGSTTSDGAECAAQSPADESTRQHIRPETPAHQVRPGLVRACAGRHHSAVVRRRCGWHDAPPPRRARREHAVIQHQVHPRPAVARTTQPLHSIARGRWHRRSSCALESRPDYRTITSCSPCARRATAARPGPTQARTSSWPATSPARTWTGSTSSCARSRCAPGRRRACGTPCGG